MPLVPGLVDQEILPAGDAALGPFAVGGQDRVALGVVHGERGVTRQRGDGVAEIADATGLEGVWILPEQVVDASQCLSAGFIEPAHVLRRGLGRVACLDFRPGDRRIVFTPHRDAGQDHDDDQQQRNLADHHRLSADAPGTQVGPEWAGCFRHRQSSAHPAPRSLGWRQH